MAGPSALLRENCPAVVASSGGVGGNDGYLTAQQYEELLAGGGGGGTLAEAYIEGGGNVGLDNSLGLPGTAMSEPLYLYVRNAPALHVADSQLGGDGIVTLSISADGDGKLTIKDRDDAESTVLGGGVDQAIRAQDGQTANAVGKSIYIGAGNGTGTEVGGDLELFAGGAESLLVLYANPPVVRLGIRGLEDHIEYTLDPDGAGFPIMRLGSIHGSYFQWGANMVVRAAAEVFIPYTDGSYSFGFTSRYWRAMYSWLYNTKVGGAITAAATIAPTRGIHPLAGVTPIATITVPGDLQTGTIRFLCTGGVNFTTVGGNVHNAWDCEVDEVCEATFDGTGWWLK